MPAAITLPRAKPLSVSLPLWPLLPIGLFAISPMRLALVEASKTENSTLILGTVNVQGTATGPFPILATDGSPLEGV